MRGQRKNRYQNNLDLEEKCITLNLDVPRSIPIRVESSKST